LAKILTIVGARPQFIKAAVVSHELRKNNTEILVHTGQHYDYNMSEMFFRELNIPNPDYNLGISGGSHAEMTAKMLVAIETVIIKEKPDWVLLYGDTNSTLAAALAAAKLYVPICHVEAGVRFHVMNNPEEINRVCVDHLSSKLLACTESSMNELSREGLSERSRLVGDPMYDAFCQYSEMAAVQNKELIDLSGNKVLIPNEYYYLTCHREENTNRENALLEILKAMNSLDAPTIYPVHPRNKERAKRIVEQRRLTNVILTEPVGYLESIYLVNGAKKIVTDSGGLQREAFFAKKKCVTVLDFVVWPETMVGNRNQLAKPDSSTILELLSSEQIIEEGYLPFGDGHSAKKIVDELEKV